MSIISSLWPGESLAEIIISQTTAVRFANHKLEHLEALFSFEDCSLVSKECWEGRKCSAREFRAELPLGLIWSVAQFSYVRTCANFTFANKIEAMHESSLVSVKVEPRSTSRLSSALFILPLFYLRFTWLKFTCVNVCSQKRVSGNQPLTVMCSHQICRYTVTAIFKDS